VNPKQVGRDRHRGRRRRRPGTLRPGPGHSATRRTNAAGATTVQRRQPACGGRTSPRPDCHRSDEVASCPPRPGTAPRGDAACRRPSHRRRARAGRCTASSTSAGAGGTGYATWRGGSSWL